jgi:hypothetical protein
MQPRPDQPAPSTDATVCLCISELQATILIWLTGAWNDDLAVRARCQLRILPEAQASPIARHAGLAEPNPLAWGHAAPSAIHHSRR